MVRFTSEISESEITISTTTVASPEAITKENSHSKSPYDSSKSKTKAHGNFSGLKLIFFF